MSAYVSILGSLGRKPETRFSPSGKFVASFSISSKSFQKSAAGEIERTDWFRVMALGERAEELVNTADKGNLIHAEGRLSFTAWLDRDGIPRVSAGVLLDDFHLIDEGEDEHFEIPDQFTEKLVETEISFDIQEISDQTLNY